MSKRQFSRNVKVRNHKTDLKQIAGVHQRNLTHNNKLKTAPKVVITHDPKRNKYHIFTTIRDDQGADRPMVHKAMNEEEFLDFVVRSHKHVPSFHPFPQEGSIETDGNGKVRIAVGHRDY